LTFGGAPSVTVAPGAVAISDPAELNFPPLSDLAVSLYLPDRLDEGFRLTGHGGAHQTNYISPPGNFAGTPNFAAQETTEAFLFLTGVDVFAPREAGCIVALGDSLTEGNLSTLDSNNRWPDQLARRLAARRGGRPLGVVNQGIGGNRLLHDGRGDNALRRFDRDVLAQPGVTHVILLIGINDLRNATHAADEVVTAPQMIAGLQQLAARGQAAGIKVFGGTLLPWEDETFRGGSYSAEAERVRLAVNDWIRAGRAFDAVIDFEAMLRDPRHPARMRPEWDCGDHLHPNDAGYRRMGDGIDLRLFG
jgi:lysophospholipase L1-like esterase